MPIATGLAIGLGVASIGGAVASSAIGAHAAGKAANAQVDAANHAADLQHQDAQDALTFQKQQYATGQQELAPWLGTGTSANVNLANLLGILSPDVAKTPLAPLIGGSSSATGPTAATLPGASTSTSRIPPSVQGLTRMAGMRDGNDPTSQLMRAGTFTGGPGNNLRYANENGVPTMPNRGATSTVSAPTLQSLVNPALGAPGSLLTPWTEQFQAPTDITEKNDPGYQARLNEGTKALANSAAARGNLFSGGTAKDLANYAENYASNEYGNVYNRALSEFGNRYNIFQNNQSNTYNRLAAQAGIGQTTASQLNTSGLTTGNSVANTLLTSGAQIGGELNNAGAARASGYVGSGNAITSGISGGVNNLMSLYTLQKLLGKNGGIPTGEESY